MTTNAISYSELSDYGHCPALYRYRNIVQIQRKRKGEALRKGTLIHRLMQAENLDRLQAKESGELEGFFEGMYAQIHEEISFRDDLFDDEKQADFDMLEEAAQLAEGYFVYWHNELAKETILHVEESFVVMLDSGEVLSCTPDVVVQKPDGQVVVRDYKSTTQKPDYRVPAPDLQVVMNFAAVQALYPEASYFEFDRLRKKLPTEPRLNKTGARKVNNLNRIDTTYEVLYNWLADNAPDLLDDPDHRRRLAELRDENTFYYKDRIPVSQAYLENGLDDVVGKLKLLKLSREADVFPRTFHASGYRSCDRCEMSAICQGELLDWDTQAILDDQYEPRDLSHKDYETEDE